MKKYNYLKYLCLRKRNEEFKELIVSENYSFDNLYSVKLFNSACLCSNFDIINFIYKHPTFLKNQIWFNETIEVFIDLFEISNYEVLDYLFENIDIDYSFNNFQIFSVLWKLNNKEGIKYLLTKNIFKNVLNQDWIIKNENLFDNDIEKFYKFIKINNF